jgi:isopentenyl-diphosphate delta-isomerase
MTNPAPKATDQTGDDRVSDMIPAWVDGVLRPFDKLEAHLKGLRHKAVSVFLLDGPKVLLQKRAATKYHTPGLWANTCCTHPHWDEPSEVCATRRLSQELGISGVTPVYRDQVEYRADVGNGMTEHELVDVFVATRTPSLIITRNPDEVETVDWVDLAELTVAVQREPDRYTPWLRIYLTEYRKNIFPDQDPG